MDMEGDDEKGEEWFAPDTEEEDDEEPWASIVGGEAAPVTPQMSPEGGSIEEGNKGLSHEKKDEALWG